VGSRCNQMHRFSVGNGSAKSRPGSETSGYGDIQDIPLPNITAPTSSSSHAPPPSGMHASEGMTSGSSFDPSRGSSFDPPSFAESFDVGVTTVMVRGLPAQSTQRKITAELNSLGFKDLFDFFLPTHRHSYVQAQVCLLHQFCVT